MNEVRYWLISMTFPKASTVISQQLSPFERPNKMNRTRATIVLDLNPNKDISRLDSLRLVSTRSIFFVKILAGFFIVVVSSFLEALSNKDLRDL